MNEPYNFVSYVTSCKCLSVPFSVHFVNIVITFGALQIMISFLFSWPFVHQLLNQQTFVVLTLELVPIASKRICQTRKGLQTSAEYPKYFVE